MNVTKKKRCRWTVKKGLQDNPLLFIIMTLICCLLPRHASEGNQREKDSDLLKKTERRLQTTEKIPIAGSRRNTWLHRKGSGWPVWGFGHMSRQKLPTKSPQGHTASHRMTTPDGLRVREKIRRTVPLDRDPLLLYKI